MLTLFREAVHRVEQEEELERGGHSWPEQGRIPARQHGRAGGDAGRRLRFGGKAKLSLHVFRIRDRFEMDPDPRIRTLDYGS